MTELNKLLDFYHFNIREAAFQIAPNGITPSGFAEICLSSSVGFASLLGLNRAGIEKVINDSLEVMDREARAEAVRATFHVVGGEQPETLPAPPPAEAEPTEEDVGLITALRDSIPEAFPFVVIYLRDKTWQTAARLKSLPDQVTLGQACISVGQRILEVVHQASNAARKEPG